MTTSVTTGDLVDQSLCPEIRARQAELLVGGLRALHAQGLVPNEQDLNAATRLLSEVTEMSAALHTTLRGGEGA